MASVASPVVPLARQLPRPQRDVLRGADRVRDHLLHPVALRHPADQQGDDGAPGRDPQGVRGGRGGQGERRGRREGVQGPDRRRPQRGGADPRGGPRAGRRDHRRGAGAGPGRGGADRRARPHPDRGRAPAGADLAARRGRHAGHLAGRPDRRRVPRGRRRAATAWSTGSSPTSRRWRPPRPPARRTGPADAARSLGRSAGRAEPGARATRTLAEAATLGAQLFGVAAACCAPSRRCAACSDRQLGRG